VSEMIVSANGAPVKMSVVNNDMFTWAMMTLPTP